MKYVFYILLAIVIFILIVFLLLIKFIIDIIKEHIK